MGPTVRDLMHPGLITCAPRTPLGDAAAEMVRHRVHALVVAEPDGPPLGILADTDLLAGEWLATDPPRLDTMRRMTAGELMSAPIETIAADAPAAEGVTRLRQRGVSRLMVLDGDRPVGVLTVSDVVACMGVATGARGSVADVMSRGIVVCRPDTPLAAAARAMSERRSRSVVVVGREGAVLGVVTGTDLLDVFGGDLDGRAVGDLMHPPLTIDAGASLRDAADAMLQHEVHRLVVVDGDGAGTPLGVVSTSDIVAAMSRPQSAWRLG